jgi:hypothetical protein
MKQPECIKVLQTANRLKPTSARYDYFPNHALLCDSEEDADALVKELTQARKHSRQFMDIGVRKIWSIDRQYAVIVWRQSVAPWTENIKRVVHAFLSQNY